MAVNNGLFRYSQRRKDDPLAPVAPYKVTSGDKPYHRKVAVNNRYSQRRKDDPLAPVAPYKVTSGDKPYQTTAAGNTPLTVYGKPTNNLLGEYSLSGDGSTGNAVTGDQVETEQTTVTPTVTPTAPADKMTVFNELYKQYFGTDFDWATATGAMPERPEGMSDDDWNTYLQRFNEGWNQYLTTGGGTGDGGTGDGGTGDSTVIPKGGYQATSFEDWWSYNNNGAAFDWETGSMGEKPEWMSQADWNYGVALYNAAKANREQQDVVKGDYDADTERLSSEHGAALAQEKANAQRQLQLGGGVYEKLQKYLPIQLRAQGLGNLGISQSAMVRSHANMANFMGDIENQSANRKLQLYLDHSNKQGQLDSEYRASKAALDKDLQEAYGDAWEAYEAAFEPIDNLETYIAQGEYEYTPEQLAALYADVSALSPEAKAKIDALLAKYSSDYYLNEISGSMDTYNSPDEVQALIDKYDDQMDADDLAEANELLDKYSSDYYTGEIYDAIASDMHPEDVQAMLDQYAEYIDETDKKALEQAYTIDSSDWAKEQINKRMSSAAELEQAIKQFGNYLTEPERTYYNNELTAMKDEEQGAARDSIEAMIESGASVDDIRKALAKYSFITKPEEKAFIDKAEERDALAYGNAMIDGALYYQVDGTVYSYGNDELSLSGLIALQERFGEGGDLKASDSMLKALNRRIKELESDPEAKKADEDAEYAAGESERVLSGEQGLTCNGNMYKIGTIDTDDDSKPVEAEITDPDFIDALERVGIVSVNDPNIPDGTTIKCRQWAINAEELINIIKDAGQGNYPSTEGMFWHHRTESVNKIARYYEDNFLGTFIEDKEKAYSYATYYKGKWYLSKKVAEIKE